jgi:hypothetical protein
MNLNSTQLYLLLCFFLVNLGLSQNSAAQEVEVSGFATVGLTHSGGDTVSFRSSLLNKGREDFSFAPDSVLGLQANVRFSENLDAVGQIILQDRTDTNLNNYVELAFLRYQINRNWSAKIGRFSTNSYLFTDYRYVGHLLTWARPPVEMYSTAGSLGNMDGLQTSYIHDVDFGAIKFSLSYGESILHNGGETGDVSVDYEDFTVFNVEFQATEWRIHAAYLSAKLDNFVFPGADEFADAVNLVPSIFKPYAEQIQSFIVPDGRRVTYASIGGQYTLHDAEFIAELSDYNGDWGLASSARSGYATASYRIRTVTPYMTLAFYNRGEQPEVIDFAAAQAMLPIPVYQQLLLITAESNEIVRGASIQQRSISLGMKWDFSDTWSFKAQFDHYRIDKFGSGFFGELTALTPSEKFTYNVANISLTTTF